MLGYSSLQTDSITLGSTSAMLYNRVGYASLILQIALYASPSSPGDAKRATINGLIIGALCGFAFYIKFTFGLVSLGLIAINLLSERSAGDKLRYAASSLVIFFIFVIIVEFVLGVHFWWLRDVRMAAASSGSSHSWRNILWKLEWSLPEVAASVVIPLGVVYWTGGKISWYTIILAIYVIIASAILAEYSAQGMILFLPIAFLIYLTIKLGQAESSIADSGSRGEFVTSGITLWCLFFISALSYPLILNTIHSAHMYLRASKELSSENALLRSIRTYRPFDETKDLNAFIAKVRAGPPLDSFLLGRRTKGEFYWDMLTFPEYGLYASEGLKAAVRGCPDKSRTANLDIVNPFPVLLGWPEGGGVTFIAPDYQLSKQAHPSPEQMYGKIDCILQPKMGLMSATFLLETYGDYLSSAFKRTYDSDLWTVWTRIHPLADAAH